MLKLSESFKRTLLSKKLAAARSAMAAESELTDVSAKWQSSSSALLLCSSSWPSSESWSSSSTQLYSDREEAFSPLASWTADGPVSSSSEQRDFLKMAIHSPKRKKLEHEACSPSSPNSRECALSLIAAAPSSSGATRRSSWSRDTPSRSLADPASSMPSLSDVVRQELEAGKAFYACGTFVRIEDLDFCGAPDAGGAPPCAYSHNPPPALLSRSKTCNRIPQMPPGPEGSLLFSLSEQMSPWSHDGRRAISGDFCERGLDTAAPDTAEALCDTTKGLPGKRKTWCS